VATPVPGESAVYVDPAGRFTVPIPTGWTAETRGEIGVLTSPEGGIVVHLLALPGDDVPAAVARAWRIVDPAFDLVPTETLEVPAIAGLAPFTLLEYEDAPPDEAVQAIGQTANGTVFVALVRGDRDEAARRASQMQTAALGIELTGVEEASLRGASPRALTPDLLADVDAYVRTTMERFGIPGAAYAVVQDGRIVHASGFGVRALGMDDPVTPETLMLVGSVTKPMTTTYMATVVDEGLIGWDQPVVEILPSFAVADPEITRTLTVRDLVCACTGVPRRDLELLFAGEGMTGADVIASLRGFEFFTPVGEAFQYSNQMVTAGGYVAALAAGGRLETVAHDFIDGMEERVFAPTGMAATTFSEAEAVAGGNVALPHTRTVDGAVTSFPLGAEAGVETVAPAGGAWSNVLELGRFVVTQLQRGVAPDGTRVVSAANLEATWEPRVAVAPGFSYGLGWIVGDYMDQPLLFHTGGTLGYNAEVSFLPEAGLGVAVVANLANVLPFAEAVRTRVWETAFDLPPAGADAAEFMAAQGEQTLTDLADSVREIDAEIVAPYLGTWNHPVLGEATLAWSGGKLTLDAGQFASELVAIEDGAAGETVLIAATPPLVGLRISLREEEDERVMVVHDPASTDQYAFARASAPATPVASSAAG
jgi:CubicO group peptidase (beta-lactamase class C family)